MKKVLIDSDIILDILIIREPFFQNSSDILNLCEQKKVEGFITPLIFGNAYYILRKIKKVEDVKKNLNEILSIVELINFSKNSVFNALNSDFSDFEDALQNYSAEENKIDIVVTRNIKDYKHSNIPVMNPENFLKTFNTI